MRFVRQQGKVLLDRSEDEDLVGGWVQSVGSSSVLRWHPSASPISVMPRASMQVPHTPTSPPRRVTEPA